MYLSKVKFFLRKKFRELLAANCALLPLTLDPFEQVKNRHAQSIRNNLNRIQRRVGLAILNSAEVGLVKPTLFAKHHLAHARFQSQRANA